MTEILIQSIRFDERGLIPAIVQDRVTKEVLSLGYMDNASLMKSLQTGQAHFSPTEAASIALQSNHRLIDVRLNPDGSSLTVFIEQEPNINQKPRPQSLLTDLHETPQSKQSDVSVFDVDSMEFGIGLTNLYSLIADRKKHRPEGSYTTYLFNSGMDKILKKVAEESGEVIIAAKNQSAREMVTELSDLFYHLLVLMVESEVKLSDVHNELNNRASQPSKSAK